MMNPKDQRTMEGVLAIISALYDKDKAREVAGVLGLTRRKQKESIELRDWEKALHDRQ